MDPVDKIRRLIDEGDSDILSKISEILGVNQLTKSLDKVKDELDQANAKLSNSEENVRQQKAYTADVKEQLARAEARIKAYEEQEPYCFINVNGKGLSLFTNKIEADHE